MAGNPGAAENSLFDDTTPEDRNLIGALAAASYAQHIHGTPALFAWFPAAAPAEGAIVTPQLRELASFARANRDAKPETIVIHMRLKGYRDTPEIAGNPAFKAAWQVFTHTLATLDAASKEEADRKAAQKAAETARNGPPAALPHHLANNPLARHPLTQQGRMLARSGKS